MLEIRYNLCVITVFDIILSAIGYFENDILVCTWQLYMAQSHAVTLVSVIMPMLNDSISVFATFSTVT